MGTAPPTAFFHARLGVPTPAARAGQQHKLCGCRGLHSVTEAEVFVKDPFVKKAHCRQGVLRFRPKLHGKTEEGVSLCGVFPMHTDDGALLFGLKRSLTCLKGCFRDDRPPDPALGICEGE